MKSSIFILGIILGFALSLFMTEAVARRVVREESSFVISDFLSGYDQIMINN